MNILILGPENRNKDIIKFLEKDNNIYVTEDKITLNFLKDKKIDWIISNGYTPIIKKDITSEYKEKIINIHPSYLPYGRGIYPLIWSLLEDTSTGVSLHFINEGIDSGDILYRKKIYLDGNLTLEEGYFLLLKEANKLFIEKWNNIISKKFKTIKQTSLQPYRSRNISEKYINIFCNLWNTKIKIVRECKNYFKNNQYFINYLKEKYD